MPLLKLQSVSKSYNGVRVLSEISLSVRNGEWVGVVGESGSGKSTLLKIIGRFIDAEEGEVFLRNNELPPVRDQLMKGYESIRLVHQEYELFPNLTARENISYALRFYEPHYQVQRVDELLNLTHLKEVEHTKSKWLSGGEKQRTALAQALAEPPELLLLDEPFAHLDQRNKQSMADAIESLKDTRSLACLFVTHDAGEAMAWADRLIILKAGEMIQEGAPEEIYNRPRNRYVAELMGRANFLPGPGQKWTMIRPNHLRPVRNVDKSIWEAKITKIRFKGSYYEYECETPQGENLVYYTNRRSRGVGDTVNLGYSPGRASILE